ANVTRLSLWLFWRAFRYLHTAVEIHVFLRSPDTSRRQPRPRRAPAQRRLWRCLSQHFERARAGRTRFPEGQRPAAALARQAGLYRMRNRFRAGAELPGAVARLAAGWGQAAAAAYAVDRGASLQPLRIARMAGAGRARHIAGSGRAAGRSMAGLPARAASPGIRRRGGDTDAGFRQGGRHRAAVARTWRVVFSGLIRPGLHTGYVV